MEQSLEYLDKRCLHTAKVTDYANGCEVCTLCGLVVQDQIFSSYNAPRTYTLTDNTHGELETYQYSAILQEGLNLLSDVCANYNISNHICTMAKRLLMEKRQQLTPSQLSIICALCFLKAGQQFSSIRTKAEVCQMFNISPKLLHGGTNKFDNSKTQIDVTKPSHILPRLAFPFSLTYAMETEIGSLADSHFAKVNASPAAVLAYALYTYYLPKKKYKLSMAQCAKLCNVSSTSIKRLCKR